MNPIKRYLRRRRMRPVVAQLLRQYEAAVGMWDTARDQLLADIKLTNAEFGGVVPPGTAGGILYNARRTLAVIEVDVEWTAGRRIAELAIETVGGGGSEQRASARVSDLEALVGRTTDAATLAAQDLAVVRSARRCAAKCAAALSDMSEDDVSRLTLFTPILAEALFEEKQRMKVQSEASAEALSRTLGVRRDLLVMASELPHRTSASARTRDKISIALEADDDEDAIRLNARHQEVGVAMQALHRDHFGGGGQ